MKTMKTNKNFVNLLSSLRVLRVVVFSIPILFSLSCENPFKAGLGPVVDIRPPNVKLESPGIGSYIWGNREFTGTADDDYKLEKVEIKVTNKPGVDLFKEYTPVTLKMDGPNRATWKINLQTQEFGEGHLKIRLKATDSAMKETETDEIAFFIKNDPPDVRLTSPFVKEGKATGDIDEDGIKELNWGMGGGTVALNSNLPPKTPNDPLEPGFNRKLEKASPIQGNIMFEEEIYGYPLSSEPWRFDANGKEWYPPQIRIWHVVSAGDGVNSFSPGEWPSEGQVPWENLEIQQTGLGRYSFKWNLDNAEVGQFYGFEIRVLSKNGRASFNYPRDFYSPEWSEEEEKENRYVLFFLKIQTSFPDVGLYEHFENLETGWNGSGYDPYGNYANYEDDLEKRAIINESDARRNGPFTLRYFARHQDDIISAELYWENETTNERGRFIWDSTAEVSTSLPYTQWGSRIPSVSGVEPGKNFVFTYTHRSDAEWNSDPNNEPGFTTKVQRFTGTKAAFDIAKLNGELVTAPASSWANVRRLGEGVYKLDVIARYGQSTTGLVNWTPYKNTVRLDLTPPTARIVTIKGAYSTNSAMSEATVNGVIEPEATFSDWRDATKAYYGTNGAEQRWLLLADDDSDDQFYKLITQAYWKDRGGYWPPVPASPGDSLTGIPQVTVVKHGAMTDAKFRFKTSPIYDSSSETDTLPDGDYWLYIAVRDDAFNVGWGPLPGGEPARVKITVKAETDLPEIIPLGEIDDAVKTANVVWPATNGFETSVNAQTGAKTFRNRLAPNANIRLRLFDDDGLDLRPANVTIKFAAARASNLTGGAIEALTGADYEVDIPSSIFGTHQETPPIRSSEPATIRQEDLVTWLKAKPMYSTWGLFGSGGAAGYNSINLPDGIYRLQIKIGDYNDPAVKLKMGTDVEPATVKKAEINIWIYVDTTPPDLTILDNNTLVAGNDTALDVWIDPTDGLDMDGDATPDGDGVTFSGTISDANGPVTVKDFTIEPRTANRAYTDKNEVAITYTSGSSARLWTANFRAPVHIDHTLSHPANGYRVTLTVVDRFGREKTVTQRYQVDLERPTVNLQTPIEMFARDDADRVKILTAGDINADQRKMLVNGTVWFVLGANDNRTVSEVRWWLLPKNAVFGGWEQESYGPSFTVDSGPAAGKKYYYKSIKSNWSQRFYIDTVKALSDNTEYNLYIMAKDSATLLSEPDKDPLIGHIKQTFFVRQYEDAPYFERQGGGNSGQTVVDKSGMIISLTITDDDGFFANSLLRPGSLKIYLDTTGAPGDTGTYNPATGWTGDNLTHYGTPLTLEHNVQGARISAQKKQITLNLDLNSSQHDYFYTKLSSDGPKHYIIEAEDSWDGKFTVADASGVGLSAPATNVAANKKIWRQHYEMILDSNDPVIKITAPVDSDNPTEQVFGETTTGFAVTGYINDTYLQQLLDNNYYFKLKLDSVDLKFGANEDLEFRLGTGAGNGYITSVGTAGSPPTINQVNFTIPSAVFTSAIKFGELKDDPENALDYKVGHGRHTLLFTVEDKSNKSGSASITFIRDLKPPAWRFSSGFNDNKTPLRADWWTLTDYTVKRNTTLPPVYYEEGSSDVPYITGTFTDDFSNIDPTKFKIIFDGGDEITLPVSQIEGAPDTTVTWTVYLTKNGTNTGLTGPSPTNAILNDGVHSLQLSIADVSGNEIKTQLSEEYAKMYGFRLISKTPESKLIWSNSGATITVPNNPDMNDAQTVYGDRSGLAGTAEVLTIRGEATGYNLAAYQASGTPVQLIIRYADTVSGQTFTPQTITPPQGTWSYTVTPGNAPSNGLGKEDVLEKYTWTYSVPRSVILAAGRGSGAALTIMRAGTYEIAAIASDRSASPKKSNESPDSVWQFFVDTKKPEFDFRMLFDDYAKPENNIPVGDDRSSPPTFWLEQANINNRNTIQDSENPRIRGTVTDAGKVAAVQLQISKWNYTVTQTNSVWQMFNRTGTTAANTWVNWTAANAALDNYWIPLPNVDPEKDSYTVEWAFDELKNMAAGLGLEDGYYRVRLRARDASTAPGGDSVSWTTNPNGNPAYSPYVFFFLDREPPEVTVSENDTGYFSVGTPQTFSAAIRDRNMVDSVVISVVNDAGTALANPAPVTITPALRPPTGASWPNAVNASASLIFPASLNDGTYRVVFTVTDFAGRTTTQSRPIKLDKTPPTAVITEPREPATGSETFQIAGSTGDAGPSGSASGLSAGNNTSGIWYHIGYGSRTALPNLTGLTGTARSDEIRNWVLGDGYTAITADNGASSNGLFNTASSNANSLSLWFKYVQTTGTYIVPPGFDTITEEQAGDLLTWFLKASDEVVNNYSILSQTIRGQTYTTTSTRRLAREHAVDPSGRSTHSLPFVVRVVDNAGNVAYELYDIKLNPNGDNPTAVINTPSSNLGKLNSRGGQMQVNGIAKDNIGVQWVIYRVKADAQQTEGTGIAPVDVRDTFTATSPAGNTNNTNPVGGNVATRYFTYANHGLVVGDTVKTGAAPNTTNRYVLWVNGNNFKLSANYVWPTDNEVWSPAAGNQAISFPSNIIDMPNQPRVDWSEFSTTVLSGGKVIHQPEGQTTPAVTTTGWYYASLGAGGSATSDWSFMLNQGGEIRDAILMRGFENGDNGDGVLDRNMIRVWIEVMVLDQTSSGSYNLISLGTSTNANNPRPYYREFYFTSSAPEVTVKEISVSGDTASFVPYTSQLAQNNIRGGRFAIRATLDGKSSNISMVQVRLPGESDPSWKNIFGGTSPAMPAGASLTTPSTTAVLTWQFDSTITADVAGTSGYKAVRAGAWAASGGTFTIEVSVRDSGSPQAEASYYFEIGVDNFIPLADTVKNITPTKVAGSNVVFLGRVFDYQQPTENGATAPLYQGVKEVHAWFTDRTNLNYINLTNGNTVPKTTNSATRTGVRQNRTAAIKWNGDIATQITIGTAGTDITPSLQYPSDTANYMKILSAAPQEGVTWSPNNNDNSDIEWQFVQDTTKWKDGWIKMHYVVFDNAGNASYYTQDMIVMNKVPQITKVTLYTNNTGEGAVFTTHDSADAYSEYIIPEPGKDAVYDVGEYNYASGYLNSDFISKNSAIGFGVETFLPGGGNPPIKYQVRYVQRYRVELTTANLKAMAAKAANASATNTITYRNDAGGSSTMPITNFVNLYTIAGDGLTPDEGKILGIPRATPVSGMHFVFQASAADIDQGTVTIEDDMDLSGKFVWAYLQSQTRPVITRNTISGTNDVVVPADLNFTGDTYFEGANQINEAQAKNTTNALNPANQTDAELEAASQGTAFFLINVWDNVDVNYNTTTAPAPASGLTEKDMLFDAVVIGMKVYVGDRRRPFARLYDLNPYTETDVTGSNNSSDARAATLANAADPIGVGDNILRGGLYNVGTVREPIKSGYIDPRGGSSALYPYVNRPSDPLDPYLYSQQSYPDGRVSADGTSISGSNRDKVSGSIILRGLAWDDQLVDKIDLNIGGATVSVARLEWVLKSDGTIVTPTQQQIDGGLVTRKIIPYTNAWVAETIHWQTGHTVEWAYLWNTESTPTGRSARGGPSNNQTVRVIVTDKKNGAALPNNIVTVAQETAPASFHNSVNVDIVPYVTAIKRNSVYATTRSRQGWYSFYQGETGIRLHGYNLSVGSGTGSTDTHIYLNTADAHEGTSLNAANRSYSATARPELPSDGHIFAITSGAVSSRINVTVGTVTVANPMAETEAIKRAWNHSSDYKKSWNSEKSSLIPGSDLWTNRPYAHIWRTTQDAGGGTATTPPTYFGNNTGDGGSWDAESPSMALEFGTTSGTSGETTGDGAQAGRLHGVWSHRSSFKTFYAANDTGAGIRLQEAQDPQAYTDVAYYPGPNNGNNITAVYTYQWDALPNILLRTHMRYLGDGNNGNPALGKNAGGTIMPYLVMRDNRAYPSDTYRWQNLRASMAVANVNTGNDEQYNPHNSPDRAPNSNAARGNAGRLFTTGYDSVGKNVIFIERIGGTNYPTTDDPNRSGLPLFIDGGNAAAGVVNSNVAGTITAAARVGNWAAVGYVSNGGTNNATTVPVIAYYDETNDTLRLAYGSSGTNNGAGNNWTRRYVLPSSNSLFRGSGKYVSLKVDRSNNIHLAFYNSTYNVMVYAVGTRTGAFTAQIVDNVIKGGEWTDIAVDNDGNPWITYGDMGRAGNYDAVRIAYKTSGTGTSFPRALRDTVSGETITGWEAVTMPANYTIADDRLNIEAWPPTNRPGQAALTNPGIGGGWDAAIGYAGTGGTVKQFRIGYFFKPANVLMTALKD